MTNIESKIVEIRKLTYAYPDGTMALDGIDLDIFEGENVGLVGPNGAGKSTLLLHLNGILRTDSAVSIFGLTPEGSNLPLIRSMVGIVFQDPDDQLFMPTSFDDVAFGPLSMGLGADEVRARVEKALLDVSMSDASDRIAHHMSVGEKRRVSIASVLSMNPRLLILDEPSANLDPDGRRSLIELLKGMNVTKIIAGHDLELVNELCQRVIRIDAGKIVSDTLINA
ncbi:MAG: ABC transporter ATP-binding protein [Candidatus Omnitrophica bacterium]|nr:ABC transporter ATP-binding protein [Candidatus Omnitrophota bacterium]